MSLAVTPVKPGRGPAHTQIELALEHAMDRGRIAPGDRAYVITSAGQSLAPFVVNQSDLATLLAAVRTHGRVSNQELTIRDSRERLVHLLVNASLQTGPETGTETSKTEE